MHSFCGLDFGTSNSTIGVMKENTCQLVPLEGDKSTIRSAIFCDAELKQWIFGQKGVDSYLEGNPGRLMMALKTVLGSSLMEDKTVIFNEYIPYTKVLSHFMQHIKSIAERENEIDLTHVVLGRPVHFYDHDREKDRHAQNTLENIAREIGFKEISFQYEPIAAALTYETSIHKEQLALIVDMGGGTSDFTVIRLHPTVDSSDRSKDVLANCGIHIAGTDFDQKLSLNTVMPLLGMGSLMKGSSSDLEIPSMYYHDLTTWHTLSNLYSTSSISQVRSILMMAHEQQLIARLLRVLTNKAGHHILDTVEKSKQRLSDENEVELDLSFIETDLDTSVSRLMLNMILDDPLQRIADKVKETIKTAGIHFTDINALFYTGGSSKMPIIREKLNILFPHATIVQGDAFGSVGMGLTIDAKRKYG